MECMYFETCGFIAKYRNTNEAICKNIMNVYCKGRDVHRCKRVEHHMHHGKSPVDEMMPSGFIL